MASTYQSSSPSGCLSLQYDSVSFQQCRPHMIHHKRSGELRVKAAPVPERKRKCIFLSVICIFKNVLRFKFCVWGDKRCISRCVDVYVWVCLIYELHLLNVTVEFSIWAEGQVQCWVQSLHSKCYSTCFPNEAADQNKVHLWRERDAWVDVHRVDHIL